MKSLSVLAFLSLGLTFLNCKELSKTEAGSDTAISGQLFHEKPRLNEIVNKARKIDGLRSLLISKNGELITENYFKPYPKDSLDHLRSVTKSVMGLLIGIAIDQKAINSIHDPINVYLEGEAGLENRHMEITIYHLLTMSGGFKWDESTVATFNKWVTSGNPVSYVLKKPIVNTPGSTFNYNSAGSHLLSVILTKASGMSTRAFAERYLFNPLNIGQIRWGRIGGYYNGGAGLELKPVDMLRIGELVANGGVVNGKTIISEAWINETVKAHKTNINIPSYGYLWWTEKEAPDRNAVAQGYGGQIIVVFPDLDAVIVATSNWRGPDAKKGATRLNRFFNLLKSDIYPYVKGN